MWKELKRLGGFLLSLVCLLAILSYCNRVEAAGHENEPATHPTTTERIEKPDLTLDEVKALLDNKPAPVFDADQADKMAVRITLLDGDTRATGFYIGNNIVVTANHVVQDTPRYRTPFGWEDGGTELYEHVLVWDKYGEVALGTVKLRNKKQDFATVILSKNRLTLESIVWAEELPNRGDTVFMIGNPRGFTWALSKGHLSREPQTMDDGDIRALVSLLGTVGSSGSPVLNARGEIVGMATQVFSKGIGILYLPIDEFKDKVSE